METTLIKPAEITKDIVNEFVLASQNKDLKSFRELLSKTGEFEIQTNDLKTKTVGKQKFIKWYESKLDSEPIVSIEYDQCIFCIIGNPVILFNHGKFPRVNIEYAERAKSGLMLNIKDDKIINIKFCFSLMKTENRPLFECCGDKIKEFMNQGLPQKEAIKKATQIPLSQLF
jgi:hypothetical protein